MTRPGLLSYADQVRLAKTMEEGRKAEERLDAARRLGAAERRRLEEQAERGDDARRELIEAHAALVLTEARRFAGDDRGTVLELVQQGNIGLVRAIDTFDWRRGVRLGDYASGWIRLAIASDHPDRPAPDDPFPDAEMVSLYRERVASLDRGEADVDDRRDRGQPAALSEGDLDRSPDPSGPKPWEVM